MPRLTMPRLVLAAALCAALAPDPAAAQSSAQADHNCACRSARGQAPLGDAICMATSDGWRVAICAMDQNVTSWRPTEQSCAPVSSRRALRPSG